MRREQLAVYIQRVEGCVDICVDINERGGGCLQYRIIKTTTNVFSPARVAPRALQRV